MVPESSILIISFKSVLVHGASEDSDYTARAVWSHFMLYFSCLFCFLKSPQLVELLKRMLQHCFAGKLQKCFGDFKTSPGFPPSKETTFHF